MNDIICGFQVVKSGSSFAKFEPYNSVLKDGDRYEGLYRMPLNCLLGDYYTNNLPTHIRKIMKENMEENNDLSIEIIKSYDDANEIYNYIKAKHSDYEIISLVSEKLIKIKGSFFFNKKRINWIGFDVISYGNGSLILDGILFKREIFKNWFSKLNNFGLFDSTDSVDDFIHFYLECSKQNIVDDVSFSNYGFDSILIGKLET